MHVQSEPQSVLFYKPLQCWWPLKWAILGELKLKSMKHILRNKNIKRNDRKKVLVKIKFGAKK